MKHCSWAAWCSVHIRLGQAVSRRHTQSAASARPCSPTARPARSWSSFRPRRPRSARSGCRLFPPRYRNVNMWQLAMAATNASSGSTCASFEYGFGTTDGDGDAGTVTPPSKVQVCSREYVPFRKSPPGMRPPNRRAMFRQSRLLACYNSSTSWRLTCDEHTPRNTVARSLPPPPGERMIARIRASGFSDEEGSVWRLSSTWLGSPSATAASAASPTCRSR